MLKGDPKTLSDVRAADAVRFARAGGSQLHEAGTGASGVPRPVGDAMVWMPGVIAPMRAWVVPDLLNRHEGK